MKFLVSLTLLIGLAWGGWWVWDNFSPFREFFREKIEIGEFRTLEIRYSVEQIMEAHKNELLKSAHYSYLEPRMAFWPYLMMEVKYPKDTLSTEEGILLWGLTDGEMVLDVKTWEKTHGFQDCLQAKADHHDFKILRAILSNGGAIERERIYQKFNVDSEVVDKWIENCCRKKLIILSGNKYRLHFENPKLETIPKTRLDEGVVAHPAKYALRSKKKYTPSQIVKLTTVAFGKDFAIRNMSEVFLPVYSISIKNPDGSVLTTYWNAVTGKRLEDFSQKS